MEIEIMNELEIPMFNKGDIVKDKFSNLFEIYDVVFTERFNRNAPGYDKMVYRLKLIGSCTSSPVRVTGNVAGFYNTGEVLWVYNTKEDAEYEEIRVTEDHLFATELELYDAEDVLDEPKSKSKIQKPTKPTKPAKAEKRKLLNANPAIQASKISKRFPKRTILENC